jgi:hypothetical protein
VAEANAGIEGLAAWWPEWKHGGEIIEMMYLAAAVNGNNSDEHGESVRKLTIQLYTLENVLVEP